MALPGAGDPEGCLHLASARADRIASARARPHHSRIWTPLKEKPVMLRRYDPPQLQVGSPPLTSRLALDSLHRGILLIDIEGYSRPPRTNLVRGRLRKSLYLLLDEALQSVGIAAGQYEPKDEGDGVLLLFGPNIPKNRLLHPLIGELVSDEHGYFGEDLDEAFGLVNSDFLRNCLAETASPLVLLVTNQIYQGIVKQETVGIDPAIYKRVKVSVKGKRLYAWLQVPQ